MLNLKQKTRALVFIGTGGVGKTTLSASVALSYAASGKKIHILTIDPSLRLAQALGFKADGETYTISNDEITKSGGLLHASVLNHEKVFSDFIANAAAKSADVEKIKSNKLFKQLSTKLNGSQDFTAIYELNQLVQSEKYDLVVLDTPPAQHTWQFLNAPEKIAQLFNEGVAQWFRESEQNMGIMKKVLNLGTTQVLRALEALTGSEFIKELSLFFQAVQRWQAPLEREVLACHKRLTSQTTEFILVTGLTQSQLKDSQEISKEILQQGFALSGLIINRFPDWILANNKANHADELGEKLQPDAHDQDTELNRFIRLQEYFSALSQNLVQSQKSFDKNLVLYKSAEVRQSEISVDGLLQTGKKIHELY